MPAEPKAPLQRADALPAATIVVLREGAGGLEVLLLRRSGKAGFFPDAWVFPGGRVDAADAQAASVGSVAGLPDADRAFAVAAIRECFEEAGVWLGQGAPPAGLRDGLNARQAPHLPGQSWLDASGLVPDLGLLRLWSWWITPEAEPKRYDTRFFVAALPADCEARHDDGETVDSRWIRVADAACGPGFFLAPPTLITLRELLPYPTPAAALAAAAARAVTPVMPVASKDEAGNRLIALPGDPLHPHDRPRLLARRLTWKGEGWEILP